MSEQIFRKKSLERVSSPEELNGYIRVSNPGVWMILAAVIVLLVGVCAWGVLGRLDTTVTAAAVSENGTLTLYVKEADMASVEVGMPVRVDGQEHRVGSAQEQPVAAETVLSDYALHVGGLQRGEWVFPVTVAAQLPEGVYSAQIVVESVSPMSFVMN